MFSADFMDVTLNTSILYVAYGGIDFHIMFLAAFMDVTGLLFILIYHNSLKCNICHWFHFMLIFSYRAFKWSAIWP